MKKILALLALLALVFGVGGCTLIHDMFNPLDADDPAWESGGTGADWDHMDFDAKKTEKKAE